MPDTALSRKRQMRCDAALWGTLIKDTHARLRRTAVSRVNGSRAAGGGNSVSVRKYGILHISVGLPKRENCYGR